MKLKPFIIIIIIVISAGIGYFYYNSNTPENQIPYGHTYVYLVSRHFGFNHKFVNFTEFLQYKFSYPEKGKFNITVTEPEQTYIVTILTNNYTVESVRYVDNQSGLLNANAGQQANMFLPFLKNLSDGSTIFLLSYNFSYTGKYILYTPYTGKIISDRLFYSEPGTIGPSNYNLTINYYYLPNGLLAKSEYIWISNGSTGEYYRNITSILVSN